MATVGYVDTFCDSADLICEVNGSVYCYTVGCCMFDQVETVIQQISVKLCS